MEGTKYHTSIEDEDVFDDVTYSIKLGLWLETTKGVYNARLQVLL